MNAIEIVMLTWRTAAFLASGDILDGCAVGDDLIEPSAPACDGFEQRRATLEFDRPNAAPFDSRRQQDLLEPSGRRFGPWDQEGRGSIRGRELIGIRLWLFLAGSLQPERQCAFAHFNTGGVREEAGSIFVFGKNLPTISLIMPMVALMVSTYECFPRVSRIAYLGDTRTNDRGF